MPSSNAARVLRATTRRPITRRPALVAKLHPFQARGFYSHPTEQELPQETQQKKDGSGPNNLRRIGSRSGSGYQQPAVWYPMSSSYAEHQFMKVRRSPVDLSPDRPDLWEVDPTPGLPDNVLQLIHPRLMYPIVFPRTWLRDACTCQRCVDPSSGQKRFSTVDVPGRPAIRYAWKTHFGDLEVIWENDFHTHDDHRSIYPGEQIRYYLGEIPQFPKEANLELRLWDRVDMEKRAPFFDFGEFINGNSHFYEAHSMLRSHGLFFLRNVPQNEKAVEKIAEKIGIIQETFYGRTWDVVSKLNAENVAYTSSFLGLHSDLLYMNDPPRIQLLHCLKNSCEGGQSTFSDGLRARFQVQYLDSELFDILKKRRVMYWYTKGVNHRCKWRTVVGNHLDVAWSPPFMNPEQELRKSTPGAEDYLKWLQAARQFRDFLEGEQYMYQYKLKEGECAVFNNLRVLHGRREFDTSTGERWLKGTYVGDESYNDLLREIGPSLKREGYISMLDQVKAYFPTPTNDYRLGRTKDTHEQ